MDQAERDDIQKDFADEFGDRRQVGKYIYVNIYIYIYTSILCLYHRARRYPKGLRRRVRRSPPGEQQKHEEL